MSNSPAIIGKPTVHDVTEDSNLQTLIAMGSISISDPNPGQAAFKTSVMSAADCSELCRKRAGDAQT